ncbi:hypothetical protein [Mucilaginibacter sp.]|uniref:hypothetical protein n=1 Tax=Mucilaginibacter sp. TaxID=1882438 RepID=UPI003D0B31D4
MVLNSKFRYLYIFIGLAGLGLMVYIVVDSYPFVNPGYILLTATIDMVFFFLAYKTYPE